MSRSRIRSFLFERDEDMLYKNNDFMEISRINIRNNIIVFNE